jgi:hypothetical protein
LVSELLLDIKVRDAQLVGDEMDVETRARSREEKYEKRTQEETQEQNSRRELELDLEDALHLFYTTETRT